MKNRFRKYLMYKWKNGKIVGFNQKKFGSVDETFLLFKELFNHNYGSIEEDENLISIHSGGWSDNEDLIEEFQHTAWWFRFHKITAVGGHYFFDTDIYAHKKWQIIKSLDV